MYEKFYIYFSEMKLHVFFTSQKFWIFFRIFDEKAKKNYLKKELSSNRKLFQKI